MKMAVSLSLLTMRHRDSEQSRASKMIDLGEDYQINYQHQLGRGTFGQVFMGYCKITAKPVAIKKLPNKDQAFIEEAKILHKLSINKNRYIVGFIEFFESDAGSYYLVQEYCKSDLRKLMRNGKINEEDAMRYLKQILLGFYDFIVIGIIHRDLKPQNILIDNEGYLKIADFGKAVIRSDIFQKMEGEGGTPRYDSPEIFMKMPYSYKCDIWSIGCILYEMIFGEHPIPENGKQSNNMLLGQYEKIENNLKFPEDVKISERCKEILRKCLRFREEDRADWQYLFNETKHPILEGLPKIKTLELQKAYLINAIRTELIGMENDFHKFFHRYGTSMKMGINEFMNMIPKVIPKLSIGKEAIEHTFNSFDKDNNGDISEEEFSSMLSEVHRYEKEEIEALESLSERIIRNSCEECSIQSNDPQFRQKIIENFKKKFGIEEKMAHKFNRIIDKYLEKEASFSIRSGNA